LAAARISAASASVIQSVGAAIGQSEVFDAPEVDVFSVAFDAPAPDDPVEPASDFFDDDPEPSASDDAAASLFEPSFAPSSPLPPPPFDAPEDTVDRRSFFAQPDPL
jgi:hypothetical protein